MSCLPFPLFNRGIHFIQKKHTHPPFNSFSIFHVFVGFFHWIGENYWVWRGNILFSEIKKVSFWNSILNFTSEHQKYVIVILKNISKVKACWDKDRIVRSTWDYTSVATLSGLTRALLTLIWWSMLDPFIFVIPAGFDNQGYRRELKLIRKTASNTQVFRFRNCKSAVQSKLGPPRLAQLGYSNVHRLYVKMEIQSNTKVLTSVCTCLRLW